jgi:hypothetical protein
LVSMFCKGNERRERERSLSRDNYPSKTITTHKDFRNTFHNFLQKECRH